MIEFFAIILFALLVLAGILVVALSALVGSASQVYGAAREWRVEARERWNERRNEVAPGERPAGTGTEVSP